MKIVVLIGNGFDINLKLKTKYSEFYSEYKRSPSSNPVINSIKSDINVNSDKWSDLEIRLGTISAESKFFTNDEKGLKNYLDFYNDLSDELSKYLIKQNKRIATYNSTYLTDNFIDRILNYRNYLPPRANEYLLPDSHIDEINFFVFNYTETIDRMLMLDARHINHKSIVSGGEYTKINLYHMHGFYNFNMVLGVNDKSQILNSYFADNDEVAGSLVKPDVNSTLENGLEKRFSSYVKNADIIMVYGMSFGLTDKTRWITIINAMLSNVNLRLILFVYNPNVNLLREYQYVNTMKKCKTDFLNFVGIDDAKRFNLEKRILICFNSEIFDKLPIEIKPPENPIFSKPLNNN